MEPVSSSISSKDMSHPPTKRKPLEPRVRVYCAICAAGFGYTLSEPRSGDRRFIDARICLGRVSFVADTDPAGAAPDHPVHMYRVEPDIYRPTMNPYPVPGSRDLQNGFKPQTCRSTAWPLYEPRGTPPSVLYLVHRPCMVLLSRYLGEDCAPLLELRVREQVAVGPRLAAFYQRMCVASMQTFWRHRASSRCFLWRDHGYFEAAQFCAPRDWFETSAPQKIAYNPSTIGGLTNMILTKRRHVRTSVSTLEVKNMVLTKRGPVRTSSAFSNELQILSVKDYAEGRPRPLEILPKEVLDMILSYLAPKEIIVLSYVSRRYHSAIPLDQRFWCDCLSRGGVSWLWDLDEKRLPRARTRKFTAVNKSKGKEEAIVGWLDWKQLCQDLTAVAAKRDDLQQSKREPFTTDERRGWQPYQPYPRPHFVPEGWRSGEMVPTLQMLNPARIWAICHDFWADETLKVDRLEWGMFGGEHVKPEKDVFW